MFLYTRRLYIIQYNLITSANEIFNKKLHYFTIIFVTIKFEQKFYNEFFQQEKRIFLTRKIRYFLTTFFVIFL